MKFELEHRTNKGEKKIKIIHIDFVSHNVIKTYGNINAVAMEVRTKWERMLSNTGLIASLNAEKEEGYKDKLKEIKKENDELIEDIHKLGDDYFFQTRLDLIKMILERNAVQDKDLYLDEFWTDNVDAAEIVRFIETVINKDEPKKK